MEIEENAFKNRGPASSGSGSQEISVSRNYRNFTNSKPRLPLQFLHDPGSDEETTYSRLQNDQQLHSVQSLQVGGSASSSGSNRKKRLYMQNRLKGCLCCCPVTSKITQIFDLSSSGQSLSIQDFGFRDECQPQSIQQDYALCYRAVEERRHTYDLLFGRHMFTGKIQGRNDDYQQESDRAFTESGFHYQFTEECINTVKDPTVFRLPIQHKEDVNYSTSRKDFKTYQKGKTMH
jgi:hypothetical protein